MLLGPARADGQQRGHNTRFRGSRRATHHEEYTPFHGGAQRLCWPGERSEPLRPRSGRLAGRVGSVRSHARPAKREGLSMEPEPQRRLAGATATAPRHGRRGTGREQRRQGCRHASAGLVASRPPRCGSRLRTSKGRAAAARSPASPPRRRAGGNGPGMPAPDAANRRLVRAVLARHVLHATTSHLRAWTGRDAGKARGVPEARAVAACIEALTCWERTTGRASAGDRTTPDAIRRGGGAGGAITARPAARGAGTREGGRQPPARPRAHPQRGRARGRTGGWRPARPTPRDVRTEKGKGGG